MKRSGEAVVSGAKRQKFKHEYSKAFPCLVASQLSECHVRCLVCELDLKCSSGGRYDCQRHVETINHKERAKGKSSGKTMKSFFMAKEKPSVSSEDRRIAELAVCRFIVEHNLPFEAMDSLSLCIRESFKDSTTAAAFKCGRTKATALIKEMASQEVITLPEKMKTAPFCLATDGSNDQPSGAKHYPVVVRIAGEEGIATGLLSLSVLEAQSTGKNIFELLQKELEAHKIPWGNCISIGSDNAPDMVGQKAGVIAFAQEKHPSLFKAGCILHLVHISAQRGVDKMGGGVEDALVETFSYFKKSSLRKSTLQAFQDLYSLEHKKCLKHVQTRWLSIEQCVERMLYNWDALKDYFLSEKAAQKSALGKAKAESLATFYRSPTNKLRATFQLYFIRLFSSILVAFQAEKPLIHTLGPAMEELLRVLLSKLVNSTVLLGADITKVNPADVNNQKEDVDLGIGVEAMDMVPDCQAHHLRQEKVALFHKEVRDCFAETCIYLQKALPFEDRFLKAVRGVDPAHQSLASQQDLLYLLRRFPALVEDGLSLDDCLTQFGLYKVLDIAPLLEGRVDKTWVRIRNEYPSLCGLTRIILGLLTTPQSSAACERVFSAVRKNLTEQRPNLGDQSLEALLVLKSNGQDLSSKLSGLRNLDKDALDRLQASTRAQLC